MNTSGKTYSSFAAALCLVSFYICSCVSDSGNIFVTDIGSDGWKRGVPAYVYVENKDTSSVRNIHLLVRHAANYGFDGLVLAVETMAPDRKFWVDTLRLKLDITNAVTEYKDVKTLYRSNTVLNQAGVYRFTVRHLMEEDQLEGIAGVGIELE